jgi:hypothetical protein
MDLHIQVSASSSLLQSLSPKESGVTVTYCIPFSNMRKILTLPGALRGVCRPMTCVCCDLVDVLLMLIRRR